MPWDSVDKWRDEDFWPGIEREIEAYEEEVAEYDREMGNVVIEPEH